MLKQLLFELISAFRVVERNEIRNLGEVHLRPARYPNTHYFFAALRFLRRWRFRAMTSPVAGLCARSLLVSRLNKISCFRHQSG
ncbi:MAG TPA: hypothetical protein VF193_15785 [Steroidobacter sp.]